mgnify:CR=1 FL=1
MATVNRVASGIRKVLFLALYLSIPIRIAPMKYELFIIDMTLTKDRGKSVVEQLKAVSAPGQIAVCHPEGTPFSYQEM